MMKTTLIRHIASTVDARLRCLEKGNSEWFEKHTQFLIECEEWLPGGSGIDRGTKIDLDKSTGDRVVLTMSFHHMNESGMYDGWTDHVITVVPNLIDRFMMRISGRDRNRIKEYLYDTYYCNLERHFAQEADGSLMPLEDKQALAL